jgi:two-component system sensor histidine kinase KdpD
VPLDAVLVEQVLFNLLDNALKYSPPGSPIEVSTAIEEREAVIRVADRGPGIAEEDRERVFDKFYRADPQRTKAGVGLGLAICRGIVTAHGGRIGANERPGGGAELWFALPLGDTPPPTVDAEPAVESEGRPA